MTGRWPLHLQVGPIRTRLYCMTKKPEHSGILIKKGWWVFRENISKDGSQRFHRKIPSGGTGKKDIPIHLYYNNGASSTFAQVECKMFLLQCNNDVNVTEVFAWKREIIMRLAAAITLLSVFIFSNGESERLARISFVRIWKFIRQKRKITLIFDKIGLKKG